MKNQNLETINIKGKEYVEVHKRIEYLSNQMEAGKLFYNIETTADLNDTNRMWVVKAVLTIVMNEKTLTYTGHAQEIIGDGFINKTSALENAETSAVGRACAMAGIGIVESIASVDEINKAKQVEKKLERTLKEQLTPDNPKFKQMIDYCENGKMDAVLAKKDKYDYSPEAKKLLTQTIQMVEKKLVEIEGKNA